MSVDYERLQELLDEAAPGPWEADDAARCGCCTHVKAPTALVCTADTDDAPLIALAPDMARELLRLHDGVKALAGEKRALAKQLCNPRMEVLNPDWLSEVGGEEPIGLALHRVCDDLTDLLEGDTE